MPIQYRCINCNTLLSIARRMIGKSIACPKCGLEQPVPALDEASITAEGQPTSEPPVETQAADANSASLPPNELAAELEEVAARARSRWEKQAARDIGKPSLWDDDKPDPSKVFDSDDDEDEEEGLSFRRGERLKDEMDLIPMVDCVFLILIFFMITASYGLQKTIQIPSPDANDKGAVQAIASVNDLANTSVIVRIDDKNSIWIDDDPVPDSSAILETLQSKMAGEAKNELVVEAHGRALLETVVAVIDAANSAQFQKVRMTTTPGTELD